MSTIVEKTSRFSGVSPCIHAWSSLLDADGDGWATRFTKFTRTYHIC